MLTHLTIVVYESSYQNRVASLASGPMLAIAFTTSWRSRKKSSDCLTSPIPLIALPFTLGVAGVSFSS